MLPIVIFEVIYEKHGAQNHDNTGLFNSLSNYNNFPVKQHTKRHVLSPMYIVSAMGSFGVSPLCHTIITHCQTDSKTAILSLHRPAS